jgi:hypothetical protein
VVRLARAGFIAAGATVAALTTVDCGDAIGVSYGIAMGDYDAATDSPAYGSADAALFRDASDGSPDAALPTLDASDGGPPLDAGSDADD